MIIWVLLGLALSIGAISRYYLRGADLRRYDHPATPPFHDGPAPAADLQQVGEIMSGFARATEGAPYRQRLTILRQSMDALGDDASFNGEIATLQHPALRGEWLIPAGADLDKRLLYLHGGAWMMGSPRSHRHITMRLATIIGGPVLALDYRLLPEHQRRDGLQDCRDAYCWLLDNGPQGSGPASQLYIAGDSAGGNLTLSLLNWIRDNQLPPPRAAVALSPASDCTLSSPSLRSNVATDLILGNQFGSLAKLPGWVLRWLAWATHRSRPCDPSISPVYADLSGLPPVLVHASTTEMLIDDAQRYVNKAQASQSPVQLQTWSHMVHVWHLFPRQLPQSEQAFSEIEKFLHQHDSTRTAPTQS